MRALVDPSLAKADTLSSSTSTTSSSSSTSASSTSSSSSSSPSTARMNGAEDAAKGGGPKPKLIPKAVGDEKTSASSGPVASRSLSSALFWVRVTSEVLVLAFLAFLALNQGDPRLVLGTPTIDAEHWWLLSAHSWTMLFGMLALGSEGLAAIFARKHLPRGTPAARIERKTSFLLHWTLPIAATVFALAGFVSIYLFKNYTSRFHFRSWHGRLGLTLFVSYASQVIFSLWLYFYGKGRVPSDLRKLLWKMHNLQGYFSYLLNFIVIGLGLWSNWATKVLGENAQFALAAGLVIISLLSIYDKVFRKKIKREKKVKEKDAKEKDVGKKGN